MGGWTGLWKRNSLKVTKYNVRKHVSQEVTKWKRIGCCENIKGKDLYVCYVLSHLETSAHGRCWRQVAKPLFSVFWYGCSYVS